MEQIRPPSVRVSRRQMLQGMASLGLSAGGLALLAGCGSSGGLPVAPAVGEPPPETRTLTLDHRPSICVAPQYVAEELLRSEGFTDIRYIPMQGPKQIEPALASGTIDIAMHFAAPNVIRIAAGDSVALFFGGRTSGSRGFRAGPARARCRLLRTTGRVDGQ